MSETESSPLVTIRFYQPDDRAAIRKICCDTGFLGEPIDPVFEDRELFADFLTAYYTDVEPDSAVVLEIAGQVSGYILGCRQPKKQKGYDRRQLLPRLMRIVRGWIGGYRKETRRYLLWLARRGWKEVPHTPQNMAHFHINLLPDQKSVSRTRDLIDFFLKYLHQCGEPAVYGQMVTFSNRRGERMFARYGFRVLDSVEVTKFREYTGKSVYLLTVIKDLSENVSLYGNDVWKSTSQEYR